MRMGHRLPLARAAALIALGELAVHQLRYLFAFGGGAGSELAAQGHSYLGLVAPIVAALALSIVAAGILRAALTGRVEGEPSSLRRTAALFAAAILIVYAAQEMGEGAAFAGHPGGAAAVLAHGGLVALPLSLAIGTLCAILDRRLHEVERIAASLRPVGSPRPLCPLELGAAAAAHPRAATPLAFGLARRPPPLPAS